MKLVRVIKYQRVRYGDLDEGDRYHAEWAQTANKGSDKQKGMHYIPKDEKVKALNLDKYQPEEVTYTIEGIPENMVIEMSEGGVFLDTVNLLTGDNQLAPIGNKVEETRYV